MAFISQKLQKAIEYYRDNLIHWYEEEYGHHIQNYSDTNLKIIASFYGEQKLQEVYAAEMAELWGSMGLAEDTELDGLDLSDTQWGYGESGEIGCSDIWDLLDLDNLFKLTKEGEKTIRKFNTTRYTYRLEVARLPCILSGQTSIRILPKILEKVFQILTQSFDPRDRICVALECMDLAPPIYLTMRKLSDFSVAALMQKVELLNSQNKFKIDNSFGIHISRTVIPAGGSNKRKHVHTEVDRRRFSESIVTVSVGVNLCLPAALCLGKYRLTHNVARGGEYVEEWKHLIKKSRPKKLEWMARQVVLECDLTSGQKFNLDDLKLMQETCFSDFQVRVISTQNGYGSIAQIPDKKSPTMKEIFLLHDGDHFDLITSMSGFHMNNHYCTACGAKYCNKERHNCGGVCRLRYRFNEECVNTNAVRCEECSRTFRNPQCFAIHKRLRNNGTSYCDQLFVCKDCDVFVRLLRRKEQDGAHQCGEMYCKTCEAYVQQANHLCYLRRLNPDPVSKELPKHIYFDFETWVKADYGHTPNMVIAQYADGSEVRFPKDGQPMEDSDAVANEFGKWLFAEEHRGYTIIAHNFRPYDGHFILKFLLDNQHKGVKVIKRGTQLLDLQYEKAEINARDTLNFVTQKLANFPKAVGVKDVGVKKGDFPHYANVPENWDTVMPFPNPEKYMIEGKQLSDKKKFLAWYEAEKVACGGLFDFRKQMTDHCSNDVTVLRKCALKFRDDFINLTGLDPFKSVTIAAACQKYFKTFVLKKDEIAIISTHGYQPNRRSSIQATRCLEWENMSVSGRIQHGRAKKEVKIGRYFVDGIDQQTKTVYEYNGCVFHGHPECTEEEDKVPFGNLTMREAYEEWEERKEYLEMLGYTVEVKWSCEWLEDRKDPDIHQFLETMNLRDPLCPRNSFFGGRTNASRLYHEVSGDEKILHYDIVSLYPSVNKNDVYPIGHPEITLSDFKSIDQYFGLVSCKILPPGKCLYPALPAKINGKLVFALCRICADTKNQRFCEHSDKAKAMDGVWTTAELLHAISVGYKVVETYEVWHWNQSRKGLFAEYINKFLKEKMEASGWPASCLNEEDKKRFLTEVKEKEDIELDATKMENNPGRKAVAKLMLNSFWGKFGQRDNMTQTKFVHEPKKVYEMCRSEAVEIHDIYAVNPECMMITSTPRDDYNEGNLGSNIAIAAFTTSYARLKLLEMMEKLDDRLLYFDTDSVIFIQKPGQWHPPTGNILGDWDNQLDEGESHIVRFVSCGPKVYSYETDTGRIEMKVKGMTQNGFKENILDLDQATGELKRTGKKLHFEQLKRLLDGADPQLQVIYPEFLKKNGKTQQIDTVQLAKTLKLVYDKRIMLADFTTIPFGTEK